MFRRGVEEVCRAGWKPERRGEPWKRIGAEKLMNDV